jgi:PTS system glucose-specific IIA component
VSLAVRAPVSGRALAMTAVPDPVFAGLMVGPGAAIDPVRLPATATAPIDGTIVKLHPHAYVITGRDGGGVLIHLGINTVELNGEGFQILAEEGQQVSAGADIVRWDPTAVAATGRSPICTVVALDAAPTDLARVVEDGDVAAGDRVFTWEVRR